MNLLDQPNVPPPDIERARKVAQLRAAAPMRGQPGQHDASDLDLFRVANEPRLL